MMNLFLKEFHISFMTAYQTYQLHYHNLPLLYTEIMH